MTFFFPFCFFIFVNTKLINNVRSHTSNTKKTKFHQFIVVHCFRWLISLINFRMKKNWMTREEIFSQKKRTFYRIEKKYLLIRKLPGTTAWCELFENAKRIKLSWIFYQSLNFLICCFFFSLTDFWILDIVVLPLFMHTENHDVFLQLPNFTLCIYSNKWFGSRELRFPFIFHF